MSSLAVVVGVELQGEQEFERHAAIVSPVGATAGTHIASKYALRHTAPSIRGISIQNSLYMLLRHDSTVFRCVACSSKLIHPLVEIAECR
jgi:hypothetical protein